jgi:uncharacterized protein (DUF1501 family)
MTMLSRRAFLHTAAACGLFASSPVLSVAAAPTDKRLVVIILRGGMDGLDVVQPIGDPAFAGLRPAAAKTGPAPAGPLDGFFQLNRSLDPVAPLFAARELAFVHAVSTPYRARSHFEAQDTLEEGGRTARSLETGWVNRLIGALGGTTATFAADIGSADSLLLRGPAPHINAYPDSGLDFWKDSEQFLELLYRDDAEFAAAFARIRSAEAASGGLADLDKGVTAREVAGLAAKLLSGDGRIAAFSIYGWDTHVQQRQKLGRSLEDLAAAITSLKSGLGRTWQDTLVVAVSEFGRTARFNGTGGTDHGTGGLALLAGGLLAGGQGGKVLASSWPGLAADQLLDDRDLRPTDDVRRYLGWLVAGIFGLSPGTISRDIFPGVDLGARLRLV